MTINAGANIWGTGGTLQNPEISDTALPEQVGDCGSPLGLTGFASDAEVFSFAGGSLGLTGEVVSYPAGSAGGSLGLEGFGAEDTTFSFTSGGQLGLRGEARQNLAQPQLSYGYGDLLLQGGIEGYAWGTGSGGGDFGIEGQAFEAADFSYAGGDLGFRGAASSFPPPASVFAVLPGLAGFNASSLLGTVETFNITDAAMSRQFAQIKEHLVAHIEQQSYLHGLATTAEVLEARVEAFMPIVASIVESLEVNDTLEATTIRLLSTAEEIYLSDGYDALAQYVAAVALYLTARDTAMTGYSLRSEEALDVSEELLAGLRLDVDTLIELVIDDVTTAGMTLYVAVTDDLVIDSEASTVAQLLAQVDEGLEAHVSIRVGDDVIHGWVVNTQNAAFSEYQNFSFNSLMEYEGRYYGLASDGLYLLDGDTDDGAEIAAAVKTGLLDMGTHYLKDAKAAHLGYNSTGELVLKVVTTDKGEKVEHWYKMKPSDAEEVRDGRVVIGRGLRARYWQFELVNVAGADFEIDDVTLMYEVLSRRIRS